MPSACYGSRPRSACCWVRPASLSRMAIASASRPFSLGGGIPAENLRNRFVIWHRLASRLTARPRYTVLQPLFCEKHYGSGLYAKAELRQYEPSLVAEVSVEADGIVAAVSKAEQDLTVRRATATSLQVCIPTVTGVPTTPPLQAYIDTISSVDSRTARKYGDNICPLLRRIDFPILSGLFKAKAVPICSVQVCSSRVGDCATVSLPAMKLQRGMQ